MAEHSDLAIIAGVRKYLADTQFASDYITALLGGYGNFAYRIHLKQSFDGKETLVLKYAAPYAAASGGTMPLPTERQNFEVEALRLVLKMHANDDIITVPTVHLFDEEAHVIIMDDCGTDARTLKQLVIDEALPQTIAEDIGSAIGHFLGRIHAWNRDSSFNMGIFANNEVGRTISSFITYGCLISTLRGQDDIAALVDPLAETRIHDINNASEAFTHGDFWPGNIMVSLRREPDGDATRLDRLYVLDWEIAKAGLRGLDIGQFCAELRLLQRFYPSRHDEVSMIKRSFISTYRTVCGSDEALARTVVAHIGAHLVAWTPRIEWGGRQETRETVAEGVELLTGGAEGTREWLEDSLVKDLLL